MIIAIDHGNFAIKTVHYQFTSGYIEHTTRPAIVDDYLEFNGKYYTLSDDNRVPYSMDKTRTDDFFILTLFAIAKELLHEKINTVEAKFIPIDLAVGLPPEHYGLMRDKFAAYFRNRGMIKFVYQGQSFSITINQVMVYPQALLAIAQQSQDIFKYDRIFVVDIGGYTTDVLLLKYGKPDMTYCRSLDMGVISMFNDVRRKVNVSHQMQIWDDQIIKVLQNKEEFLPDDVKSIVLNEKAQYINKILRNLAELQINLRSTPSIFVGGGSILFRDAIENSEDVYRPMFVEDSKANAIGYYIMAQKQLSQKE